MRVQRYDKALPLREPVLLPNGFLRADGYLTRTGIFVYRDSNGRTVRELRTPDEVMSRETVDSFALVPVTNDHPPELLTADNAKQYAVGAVSEQVQPDGDKLRASLMITDAKTIEAVQKGKIELSCGYTADVVAEAGTWNGQRYDARQTNIRGNHVAIVDVGRAGPECALRMDAADGAAQEITMDPVMMELGGAQYAVPADLAAEIAKMLEAKGLSPTKDAGKAAPAASADLEAAKADLKAAKADNAALRAKLDGLTSAAAAKAMREKLILEIREDMAVSDLAKRLDCAVSESDTTAQKRRKIIAKLDAAIKLDGRSDAECSGLLEGLLHARGEQAAAAARAGAVKTDASAQDDSDPAEVARKEMLDRYSNAHKKGAK